MYNAVLLASALATPSESEGRDAFEHYLNRLLDWSPLLDTGLTRPLCSYDTINALFESGAYPFTPHIRDAIDRFGLREFSVQDIAAIADFLLSRSEKLEDITKIKEVLYSFFRCDPEPHGSNESPVLREANIHSLALLASWFGLSTEDEAKQICICAHSKVPRKIHVRTTIEDIESTTPLSSSGPFSTQATFRLASDLPSAVCCLNEQELWRSCTTPTEACLALHVAYYKDACNCGSPPEWSALPKIIVRQELLESARHLGFKHDPSKMGRLLSAVVDAMAARNQQHTHALRTDRGGNAPQRRRGDDKAFRWDIDYEFHLHYWATSSGALEFAKVVTHNDFSIPD